MKNAVVLADQRRRKLSSPSPVLAPKTSKHKQMRQLLGAAAKLPTLRKNKWSQSQARLFQEKGIPNRTPSPTVGSATFMEVIAANLSNESLLVMIGRRGSWRRSSANAWQRSKTASLECILNSLVSCLAGFPCFMLGSMSRRFLSNPILCSPLAELERVGAVSNRSNPCSWMFAMRPICPEPARFEDSGIG